MAEWDQIFHRVIIFNSTEGSPRLTPKLKRCQILFSERSIRPNTVAYQSIQWWMKISGTLQCSSVAAEVYKGIYLGLTESKVNRGLQEQHMLSEALRTYKC